MKKALEEYTDNDLTEELVRREIERRNEGRPVMKPLNEVDLSRVAETAEKFFDNIVTGKCNMFYDGDLWRSLIYDEIMQALYGKDYAEWVLR